MHRVIVRAFTVVILLVIWAAVVYDEFAPIFRARGARGDGGQ